VNAPVALLTWRQLLGKRRTLLLVLFALVPVLVAVAFRFGDADEEPARWTARTLMGGLVIGSLLPLAALIMGTAAIGTEIEDGTVVYLLGKPVRRIEIVTAKLGVAWFATAVFILVSAIVSGLIAVQSADRGGQLVLGFALAGLAGAFVYTAVFIVLSVVTTRAFVVGITYVFLWEGIITRLFTGTRILSIRQYTLGLADLLADAPRRVFEADLGAGPAVVMMAVVSALAIWYAARRLTRFELGEGG
jgi:ABC-2 type transport system permease protein